MANEVVDHGRRRFLTAATAVVGGVGVVSVAVPFIKSWEPSARAKAAGAPVTQSLAKVESGQQLIVGWRSLPVFIVNRTKDQLATLPTQDARLVDPKSDGSSAQQQPTYAQNETRSIKPEWLVMIGICTHLGCVPGYVGEMKPEPFDPDWKGGYYCPCHHSRSTWPDASTRACRRRRTCRFRRITSLTSRPSRLASIRRGLRNGQRI